MKSDLLLKRTHEIVFCIVLILACNQAVKPQAESTKLLPTPSITNIALPDTNVKSVHVFVALCDNKYQGIVPVPPKIGNGQDAANNLYWGCSMGIKSYFTKSASWKFIKAWKINDTILERAVWQHKQYGNYLIADAYDGRMIKTCTIDFFKSCAGIVKDTLQNAGKSIGLYGNARLVAYIGHDGLMDFRLNQKFDYADGKKRDAIMLACISKRYFGQHLQATNANPLLWSTGLMSPEAYTLHDAMEAYFAGAPPTVLRQKAALAYACYQKCSKNAAENLLVTGF